MAEYIFVYGTLLKGESFNSLLKGCILKEYLSIPGILYDTGNGFPAAYLKNNTDSRIYGELYKLPANNERIIRGVDFYEDMPSGIFKRNTIKINSENCLIYNIKDPGLLIDLEEIESGSWLEFCKTIKNDPLSFALNFENSQKFHYRHLTKDSIITLPGSFNILVSAPHATNHIRFNKVKIFERYTAAIAALMHSIVGTSSVYTNSVSITDPNYYDQCEYKQFLKEFSRKSTQHFVLDIHGTGENRKCDIYPGIGRNMEFLLGNSGILEDLTDSAVKFGIKCGGLDKFPASKQQTVTKYCASKLGIPSMQLEINKKYRQPDKYPEKFLTLIVFLKDFLEKIKKGMNKL